MKIRISKLKLTCLSIVLILIAFGITIGALGRNVKKVVLSGDPDVMTYVEKLSYYYSANVKKNVAIDVNAPGASQAVKDVNDGLADFGFVARKLSASEASNNIVVSNISLASEAYVVIVNSNFPLTYTNSANQTSYTISSLPKEYVAEMFYKKGDPKDNYRGDFNYWRAYIKDVSGDSSSGIVVDSQETINKRNELFSNMEIKPVQRPYGDGLRESFDEFFSMEQLLTANKNPEKNIRNYSDKVGVTKDNDGEILNYIKNNDGSVGYVKYSTYKANKYDPITNPDGVQLLPISSVSGNLIRELSADNFTSSSADNLWPLRRNFTYFYNKNLHSDIADDFISWVTTGFTNKEFEQYAFNGKITDFDDTFNTRKDGTIPFIIGSQESIIPDYETNRKIRVQGIMQPIIDKSKKDFPYHSSFENGQIKPKEVTPTSILDLPLKDDNMLYTYELKEGSILANFEYTLEDGTKTDMYSDNAISCNLIINADNVIDASSDTDKTLNRLLLNVTYTAGNTSMSKKDVLYNKIHLQENEEVYLYVNNGK